MRVEGFIFGHAIYTINGTEWFYVDNDEPIRNAPERKCPKCDKYPTNDGHDPCIADLPGVDFACCGHGVEQGYVKFSNGQIIRGKFDKLKL
jgi:hypothetical protein